MDSVYLEYRFLLISRINRSLRAWFTIGVLMAVISSIFIVPYFGNALRYSIWLVVGVGLAENWNKVIAFLRTHKAAICAALFLSLNAGLVVVLLYCDYGGLVKSNAISSLLCLLSLLAISDRIANEDRMATSALLEASRYSFSIYLLSPWVQVAVRVFLYTKLGVPYIICMLLMFLLGFAIPYVFLKAIELSSLGENKTARYILGL